MPSKTTINWLFDNIWCYLFIACFDWKTEVFQQTVVRVYYILKRPVARKRLSRHRLLVCVISEVFFAILGQEHTQIRTFRTSMINVFTKINNNF